MIVPEEFQSPYQEANRKFREAAAAQLQPEQMAEFSRQSLERALEAAEIAVSAYASQRLARGASGRPCPPRRSGVRWANFDQTTN